LTKATQLLPLAQPAATLAASANAIDGSTAQAKAMATTVRLNMVNPYKNIITTVRNTFFTKRQLESFATAKYCRMGDDTALFTRKAALLHNKTAQPQR
jgi:hypothetical protein